MSKVLVIGIDSLDVDLISRFEDDLPNFKKLKKLNSNISFKSVFPPDSETAWSTIYTGLDPAKHGIVNFVDPLDKVNATVCQEIDNTILVGKTFWDIAGKNGKKVCVILPHLGYPVWQVNGVMVGRASTTNDVQANLESISKSYDLSVLNTLKGCPPKKQFDLYIEYAKKIILNETEFGLKLMKECDWDLFFIYSSKLDWIQHNLWMYFDEKDPSYPGDNPYKNTIKDFYILYDEMIGKFIDSVEHDTPVIILSDHGHGMRPINLLNINKILKEEGLLISNIKEESKSDPYYLIEKLKVKAADVITTYGLGDVAKNIIHVFPMCRTLYTKPMSIDWENTVAYISDLSGIKAYSYGGIVVKKEKLKDNDTYENIRNKLILDISKITDPSSGKKLVKWISKREDLYYGEYITRYPDIVFQLEDGFGGGWATHGSLITQCATHNIMPGSHRGESPVLLMANLGERELTKTDCTLMDIAPTVLKLLDIETNIEMDGMSIV
jgi:predicted AlkP superfamily phosphohydrolase/phosphomutase